VKFIDTEDQIKEILELKNTKGLVGISFLSCPVLLKEKRPPAILQIGNKEVIYIIDLIKLNSSDELNEVLSEIVTSDDCVLTWFNIKETLSKL